MKINPGEQIIIGYRGPKGERVEVIASGNVYDANGVFKDDSIDDFYEALTKVRKRYEKIKK